MDIKKTSSQNKILIVLLTLVLIGSIILFQIMIKKDNIIKVNETCEGDECIYEKAINPTKQYYDEKDCSEIQNEDLKYSCFEEVHTLRVSTLAVQEDNVSKCDELEIRESFDRCINNFYLVKVLNTGDKSYCENVTKEELRNECYK